MIASQIVRLAQWRDQTRETWALLAGGGDMYLLERALYPMPNPRHYAQWLVRIVDQGEEYLTVADWLLTEYEGQLRAMFTATRPAVESLGVESPSVGAVGVPAPSAPGTAAGEQSATEGVEGVGTPDPAPSTELATGAVWCPAYERTHPAPSTREAS